MDNKTIYIIIGIAALLFLMSTRQTKPKQTVIKVDPKFPCANYPEDEFITISKECANQIAKEAGCPNPNMDKQETILSFFKENAKDLLTDPYQRSYCYGPPDTSKWPVITGVPYVSGRYVSIGFPNNVKGTSIGLLEMEVVNNQGIVVSYKKPVSGKNITIKNPGSNLTDVKFSNISRFGEIPIKEVQRIANDIALLEWSSTVEQQNSHKQNATAKLSGMEPGEFFEIDLGKSYDISYIDINTLTKIFNQLSGVIVIISNKPNREEPVYTSNPIPDIPPVIEDYGTNSSLIVFPPEKNINIENDKIISYFDFFYPQEIPLPTPEELPLPTYIRRRY